MPSRPRRSRGPAVALVVPSVAVLVVSTVAALAVAAPASADVAALAVDEPDDLRQPSTVRVAVRTSAGAVRRLGPFSLPAAPGGLLASPDGRRALLLPPDEGRGGQDAYVLALDGSGGPVPLRLPQDVVIERPYSQVSWTPDGSTVVVGDAERRVRRPGADPDDEEAGDVSWTALSCPVDTVTCAEVAGPGGSAVGVPGGILVSSSVYSLLPLAYLFAGAGDVAPPEWTSPTSAWGRLIRGVDGYVRVSATHLEGPAPRTVGRAEGPASRGLPYTWGMVGGPSGALLTRYTFRTRLLTRDGRIRLRESGSGPRLSIVTPDGVGRTTPTPKIRVAAGDLRVASSGRQRRTETQRVIPVLGRLDGGWLGVADDDPEPYEVSGRTLVTIDPAGRARPVRVAGGAATAERIVAALPGGRAPLAVSDLSIVGYERATRRVVVRLQWRERTPGTKRTRAREEAVRVRPDGRGRPQVVTGGADTAW
ncbi:hypothetical protein AB0L40_22740 [Patulibacter sp. NPDC049589]|uniref:hypothetical protein n=1 Tax=Patulibacter sp. NPDC049589 TaxID=3154731 RepID=UPI00343AF1C4